MGSYSWNKADTLTDVENVAYGEMYKFLIPIQFGGGFLQECYQDYGKVNGPNGERYDMYELLAFWNGCEVQYNGERPLMKEIDEYTVKNRVAGICIGCYDKDISNNKYPLKLVSVEYEGTYEELDGRSFGDPDQGFYERKRIVKDINN